MSNKYFGFDVLQQETLEKLLNELLERIEALEEALANQ